MPHGIQFHRLYTARSIVGVDRDVAGAGAVLDILPIYGFGLKHGARRSPFVMATVTCCDLVSITLRQDLAS